jgi:hypothetical protein
LDLLVELSIEHDAPSDSGRVGCSARKYERRGLPVIQGMQREPGPAQWSPGSCSAGYEPFFKNPEKSTEGEQGLFGAAGVA